MSQTRDAIESGTRIHVPESVKQRLADLWEYHREQLEAALQARMTEVEARIRRHLGEQLAREQRDIEHRLRELERQIEKELDAMSKTRQLTLDFSGEEQVQLELDLEVIRDRLERIPADIKSEQEALAHRYSITEPHLFPVAVEYLIPRAVVSRMARD